MGVVADGIALDGEREYVADVLWVGPGPRSAVQGRVLMAGGAPVDGVQVRLLRDDAEAGRVQTDAGGAFRFPGLPGGVYALAVGEDGPWSGTSGSMRMRRSPATCSSARPGQAAGNLPVVRRLRLPDVPSGAEARLAFSLATDYLIRTGATGGFSVDEAAQAQQVIIVGDVVPVAVEGKLRAAGCQVMRLAGDGFALAEAFKRLATNIREGRARGGDTMTLFNRMGNRLGGLAASKRRRRPQQSRRAASTAPREAVNDAQAYGVAIVPAAVPPGAWYWQAVRVHHLTPEENGGNHHIFLDLLDPATATDASPLGGRVFGARVRITWEGGEQVVTLEKPVNEPGDQLPDVEVAGVRCGGVGPARRGAAIGPRDRHAYRASRRGLRKYALSPLVRHHLSESADARCHLYRQRDLRRHPRRRGPLGRAVPGRSHDRQPDRLGRGTFRFTDLGAASMLSSWKVPAPQPAFR